MINFEDIEKEIENVTKLENLFELWEKAHICEDAESAEKTISYRDEYEKKGRKKIKTGRTLYVAKNSFIKDGYIDELENNFNGILFILKEANELSYEKNEKNCYEKNKIVEGLPYSEQYSFYRKYIEKVAEDEGLNRPKQQEKMGVIAYYLETKDKKNFKIPNEKYDYKMNIKEALKNSAFMNLNKRGGANVEKTLNEYVKKYHNFIEKQIDIIKPKYIIWLGTYKYRKIIDFSDKNIVEYDMWHTACPPRKKGEIKTKYGIESKLVDWYLDEFINRVNKNV